MQLKSINVKVDKPMAQAIREAAQEDLTSMSAVVRKAIDLDLQRRGINWRGYQAQGDGNHGQDR